MLRKRYIRRSNLCEVTFELPEFELPRGIEVKSVHLVGDSNNWDRRATPMKRGNNGAFRTTLELETEKWYEFRYLINGELWFTEWHADAYVPDGQGGDNCVVVTRAETE